MRRVLLVVLLVLAGIAPTHAASTFRVEVIDHTAADWPDGAFDQTALVDGSLRLLSGRSRGAYTAPPIEASSPFMMLLGSWTAQVEPRQTLTVEVRTSADGQLWSEWQGLPPRVLDTEMVSQLVVVGQDQRWIQFRILMTAQFGSPTLAALSLTALETPVTSDPADLVLQPLAASSAGLSVPQSFSYTNWSEESVAVTSIPHRTRRIEIESLPLASSDVAPSTVLRALEWAALNRWNSGGLPYHLVLDAEGRLYDGPVPLIHRLPGAEEGAVRIGVLTDNAGSVSDVARKQLSQLLEWLLATYRLRPENIYSDPTASPAFSVEVEQIQTALDQKIVQSQRIFASGGNASQQRLLLFNPTDTDAHATVTAYTPDGEPQQVVSVPAGQRSDLMFDTLFPDTVVQGVDVKANRLLYAERVISDGVGLVRSSGVEQPARTWYFAHASTLTDTETLLSVLNPQADEVATQLVFYTGSDPITHTVMLAPRRQTSISLNDMLPDAQFGVQLVAAQPVVAEQTTRMPSGNTFVSTGSPLLERRWSFAEGVTTMGHTTTLHLLNPWPQRVALSLQILSEDGTSLTRRYAIPPQALLALTLNQIVPDLQFAVDVVAERSVVVERAISLDHGTSTSVTPGSAAYATRWTFVGGSTEDSDRFLLVGNPQRTATGIRIQYVLPDGNRMERHYDVPPAARLTIWANDDMPDQPVLATVITADQPVVAERTLVTATSDGRRIETGFGAPGN